MLFIPEIATPEPALSGSEGARNDREGSHHEAHPPFLSLRGALATKQSHALQGNPKLKALNSKQILISKFKTRFSSYQLSVIS